MSDQTGSSVPDPVQPDGAESGAPVRGFPSGSHRPESKAAEAAIEDIATVRGSVPTNLVLKVIIESGALTDDEIVQCCESDETAGGVKASGGVRTWDAAVAMMNAGATRIGTSSTEAILGGAHA